ncbi:Alpha/Beta hydrolase protein [Neohortaea acidophila]|uniref:Alpha/Beta hydrolase protein n=1 Tax=Neohortaea acidophila TaxID=245834 RepID=A0A6A6PLJ2_9PEZI|nr:Alpha/Beta hydrolase protein [Neohortaea acidophila]KAF2480343.1 Alpha/Beta hydrolase protein [Neohortaea acidophila]
MPAVLHKTAQVDGVKIFYREAGSPSSPGLLLLHGHASASHTFRNIIPGLADSFHVVAPDYPGFGNSDRPDAKSYTYTFENIAKTLEKLTEQIGVTKYYLYIFDFGGPIGGWMFEHHPDKVLGLFTQSGNLYVEGISEDIGKQLGGLWKDPHGQAAIDGVKHILEPHGIAWAYTNIPNPERVAPEAPDLDAYYTTRPGAQEIQLDLLRDYQNVPPKYGDWQKLIREHKPKIVARWGEHDPFFRPPGAEAFKTDSPNADVKIIPDGGHFLNETHPEEIIAGLKKLLA